MDIGIGSSHGGVYVHIVTQMEYVLYDFSSLCVCILPSSEDYPASHELVVLISAIQRKPDNPGLKPSSRSRDYYCIYIVYEEDGIQ